jgi:hypothetical protein
MAIVAIGIESLMICPVISITYKKEAGGTTPPTRQGTGHAIPVKRSSGGTPAGSTAMPSAVILALQPLRAGAFARSITHGDFVNHQSR